MRGSFAVRLTAQVMHTYYLRVPVGRVHASWVPGTGLEWPWSGRELGWGGRAPCSLKSWQSSGPFCGRTMALASRTLLARDCPLVPARGCFFPPRRGQPRKVGSQPAQLEHRRRATYTVPPIVVSWLEASCRPHPHSRGGGHTKVLYLPAEALQVSLTTWGLSPQAQLHVPPGDAEAETPRAGFAKLA